jgi:hypothetical protein
VDAAGRRCAPCRRSSTSAGVARRAPAPVAPERGRVPACRARATRAPRDSYRRPRSLRPGLGSLAVRAEQLCPAGAGMARARRAGVPPHGRSRRACVPVGMTQRGPSRPGTRAWAGSDWDACCVAAGMLRGCPGACTSCSAGSHPRRFFGVMPQPAADAGVTGLGCRQAAPAGAELKRMREED